MAEPQHYTAAEKARLAGLVARAGVQIKRGKSTASVDRAIERLQQAAVEREQAEQQAAVERERARIEEKARKRAARTWF